MKPLDIKLKKDLNFHPPLIGYLASIGENEFSYRYYNLRHPGGIFSLQLNNVVDDFLELLSSLKQLQNKEIKAVGSGINKEFSRLIINFFKYYESCYEIILACCKEHKHPNEREFLHGWLKKFGYEAGKQFYSKVKEDTKYFRELYNKLKHTSNDLRIFCFYNENRRIMGYYLESVNVDGSLGPFEGLHPLFHNKNSANSFNLSLRQLYYCLYKIADVLCFVLIKHFKKVYNISLRFNNKWVRNNCKYKGLIDLYDEIKDLPELFFPNELDNFVPMPNLKGKYLDFQIIKPTPINLKKFRRGFATSGDGFSRSFRLPFY